MQFRYYELVNRVTLVIHTYVCMYRHSYMYMCRYVFVFIILLPGLSSLLCKCAADKAAALSS